MKHIESSGSDQGRELSVTQINALIKKCIDSNFGLVRVRGEISGLKIASSGHAYFNLKEKDCLIACTCWRAAMSRLQFILEDGIEVVITGKVTTYSGQSKYQLSVELIEANGSGALMAMLLKRKETLAKEGLFDLDKKKKIPFLPLKIGVITSPVGAVIQDIIHRVKDRFPINIILWPVAVQGDKCAIEVSEAINGFNSFDNESKPDLIIVARGGGSIEDLWGFNEEIVVRATANSEIPIISAIGHETDITLIDFASSLRAPTPTAAAEMALPVARGITARLHDMSLRIANAANQILESLYTKLKMIHKSFYNNQIALYSKYQKLDDLSFRLQYSLPNNLKIKQNNLLGIKIPLHAIHSLIEGKLAGLCNTHEKAKLLTEAIVTKNESQYELQSMVLESLDIKKILKRGFVLARSMDGRIVSSSLTASNARSLELEWYDGTTIADIKTDV